MRRFYINKNNISKNLLTISGEEAHHIRDVIRLKTNDKFTGFDGEGFQYLCRIDKIETDKITAVVENAQKALVKIPKVCLACAIPKAGRIDYIIQKAAELRVQALIPMLTARTAVKIDNINSKNKILRWKKIAMESSKQCGRDDILEIDAIKNFSDVIKDYSVYNLKLIPCLSDKATPLKEVLSKVQSRSAIILIGPEGDFTPSEISIATKAGFLAVSLGPSVLRVDTAAIFTISAVMYELF